VSEQEKAAERRRSLRIPVNLTLEAMTRSGSQFYTTRDVSLQGCYVEAENILEPDHIVKVIIYLPGDDEGIRFVAHVRHGERNLKPEEGDPEGYLKPSGMGLEIFVIDGRQKARWVEYISTKAQEYEEEHGIEAAENREGGAAKSVKIGVPGRESTALEPPRRRHVRHPVRMEVQLNDMKSLFNLFSKNLSVGGIYVESERKPPLGDHVEVTVGHPMTGEQLVIPGKVARTDEAGIGIRFTGLTEGERRDFLRFALTGKTPDFPE